MKDAWEIFALALGCGFVAAATASAAAPAEGDYPFRPVPFTAVKVDGGFWGPRFQTNREVTVWYDFAKCEETGRIANFARAGGLEEGPFQGIPFDDSDVFKVIEGAAYVLAQHPDEKLDRYLDELIAKIAAAQEDDGYLYTARTLGRVDGFTGPTRWSNLGTNHELYNVGHLYEAAVAHYEATGKRALLDVALRSADLVCKVFGPGEGQRVDVPGHQQIEIGLVRLYRATGERKYLDQAKFFIDMRGRKDLRSKVYGAYCQDHLPLVEQEEAVGHAVRGGYFYAGAADVAALTGQADYLRAIDRIWRDVVEKKLYLIGSVGQHGAGEGYAGAYKLPNLHAYNETCASIALALWNYRMFLLHGEAKYIDLLERTIYNGFLAGVALSGDRFFYPNPLACDMHFRFNHGSLERSPWFGCSCCPVNVVRFIPSIAGYVYATREDALYVNLFVQGAAAVDLAGRTVRIAQTTDYPWDGRVRIAVDPQQPGEFELRVRIPGFVEGRVLPESDLYAYENAEPAPFGLKVNGADAGAALRREAGYAVIRRQWAAGDAVELELPLPVRRVRCHEAVEENRGRVAIERGPLVYCAEGADHGGQALNLFLPPDAALTPEHRPDLLGGVTVLVGEARAAARNEEGDVVAQPARLTLIPYYAWCHRGANEMQVWLPQSIELARVPPRPTIASTSRAGASHVWQHDSTAALNDQVEPKHSADHELPRFTWWDRLGTREWVQYDFARPTPVRAVEVYWFDDTGRGRCRVPQSWQVLYRDGQQWKPAAAKGPYGVERDRFNRVEFEPVTTDGLRLEVQLQPDVSGGILEWRVE